MSEDIRDKASIRHGDVIALNFIDDGGTFFFRRHFRQGLRSHVMEILKRADIAIENTGTLIDGVRWYPKARPAHMLRIFRTRLETLQSGLAEIARVKVVEDYLGPDFIAESSEFLVDYRGPAGSSIMLCGFQVYVQGEILDPWSLLDGAQLLPSLYASLHGTEERSATHRDRWISNARENGHRFVCRIKQMIADEQHIPDLAGAGNLVVPKSGAIKLVDINNISPVTFDGEILLDDKGYPVCDKSIEALSLIETKFLDRPLDRSEKIYRFFLARERQRKVGHKEARFYRKRAQFPRAFLYS
ncbi:MAG: hypothetical protein PVJ53_11710 [Desulfobacterales bacterium]|jgi:hypothetical protein